MDLLTQFFSTLYANFTNLNSRLAVLYLCCTVLIVAVLWIVRGRPKTFTEYLLPKDVYLHKSNLVDIKLFFFNTLVRFGGFLTLVAVTPVVAASVIERLSEWTQTTPSEAAPTFWLMALATVIIILTNDFCTYWVHRIHHEAKVLWPFHSVHHSAEVMTPLTVYRKHPIYDLLNQAFKSCIVGAVQGVMLFAVVGEISVLTIGTANLGYVIFNFLGANLRHSHIWLSYGPLLEHVLISPAQHQIHHSVDHKHYNKNYGEVFAIWDLMFGTLYVPQSLETLQFGLSDKTGNRIEQPHPTLRAALIVPFVDCWQTLWKGTSRDARAKHRPKVSTTL